MDDTIAMSLDLMPYEIYIYILWKQNSINCSSCEELKIYCISGYLQYRRTISYAVYCW